MTLQCKLSILIRMDSFAFMVTDLDGVVQVMREFPLTPAAMLHPGMALDRLEEIVQDENLLHAPYDAVQIGILSPLHTLLPESLYEEGNERPYLEQLTALDEGMEVRSDHLGNAGMYNFYAYPASLFESLEKAFPDAMIRHFTSFQLSSMQIQRENQEDTCLFLHVWEAYVLTSVFEGENLIFSNIFPFRHPQDVLYYLLLACRQANEEPEDVSVFLSGNVTEDSTLYRELCRLAPELERISLEDKLPANYEGDAEILNAYTDLYSVSMDLSHSPKPEA